MIVVIATMRAHLGKDKVLGDLLHSLLKPTRDEAGCLQYDLHVSEDDPCSYAFYERWESRRALEAHLESPHLTSALPRMTELTAAPPSIAIYRLAE
jgi:quinol monooxygenase YgiN